MSFPSHTITRRGLFRAGAATGVAAAAVGVLSGCTHSASEDSSDQPVVVDTDQATYVIDPNTNDSLFSVVDMPLVAESTYSISLGSVLRPAEGNWLPTTLVGATASPAIQGGAFSLDSGTVSTVVSNTILQNNSNAFIYDVRCSDQAYAWVEVNLLDNSWSLYAAPFADGKLTGNSSTLWEADANWDPPRFAVTDKEVIWQVMPSTSGDKTSEHSFCYLWKLGDTEAIAVVESPGRFATGPEISNGTVTLVPRVKESQGVYYGITAYSLEDDLSTVVDRLVLPQSVSPLYAVRMDDKFVFSIEATYSSGGLLATMGTYVGTSDSKFVVLSREPYAEVAGKGSVYVIKSRSSYFVVDTENEQYSTLEAANRAVDYGEFPARDGVCDKFITFSTVKDADTGYPTTVQVRIFNF
ncbi:MAG: Tat pathway signal protein [Olegusella sp.]|jgi:hypothetical protein|nr:Tat pathway signal protein [Olegusella sp.]MCI1933619.1 Tat pathway signal protein [Atopobiaceae bacterium]NLH92149.1 Tat pathway signal protein [Atopobium sp.]